MKMHYLLALAACASTLCGASAQPISAQAAPAAMLAIDLENYVTYAGDTTDVTKFATNPSATPGKGATFETGIAIADIFAVNGLPAKGTFVFHGKNVPLAPTPNPSEAIVDTDRSGPGEFYF